MLSHDAFGFFRLRIAGVVAELKRAAQKNRIGAGEHIQITVAAADREGSRRPGQGACKPADLWQV